MLVSCENISANLVIFSLLLIVFRIDLLHQIKYEVVVDVACSGVLAKLEELLRVYRGCVAGLLVLRGSELK